MGNSFEALAMFTLKIIIDIIAVLQGNELSVSYFEYILLFFGCKGSSM